MPIKRIIGGKHILADLTLPYGKVVHDYLEEEPKLNIIDWKIREDPHSTDFSKRENVLKAISMPIFSPSFSNTDKFEMHDREHYIFRYKTTPEAIAKAIPEPLIQNEENEVVIIFTKTDGSGLANYSKCEMFIPCQYKGEHVLFEVQGYADSSASRTTGREVLGQPLKYGNPNVEIKGDTIVAKLEYSESEVVTASMAYNYGKINSKTAENFLRIPYVNLKLIPGSSGKAKIAYLTKFQYEDIKITESYFAPADLELLPHINAPFSDFPVLEVIRGSFIKADLSLGDCQVLHDYVKNKSNDSLII